MKINIKIGGKILTATLADNATAQDFVSVLPLKVSMNDLFGREKYGELAKGTLRKGTEDETLRGGRCRVLVSLARPRYLLPAGW